jgi:plasmid maintenance system antidote protein VapI
MPRCARFRWRTDRREGYSNRVPSPQPPGGEILIEEFLEPLQVSQNRLAVAVGGRPRWVNKIV